MEQEDPEMTSMFASVWVKVEVEETNENYEVPPTPAHMNFAEPLSPPPVKEKKKRPVPTKLLYCDSCDYSTPYKSCLTVHIINHSNVKPYICEFCDYRSKFSSSLRRHIAIRHRDGDTAAGMTTFVCDECDYVTYCNWNLKAHKRKHKTEKKYKCSFPECGYATAYRNVYTKHLKKHQGKETLYKCDKCKFETKFHGHIQRHLTQIHDEPSTAPNACDLCGFSHDQKWKLKMHLLRSKRREELTCICCGWKTFYRCAYRKHSASHDKNKKKNASQPETSITTEIPSETYDCDMCIFVATSRGQLQRHNLENHYRMEELLFKCESCQFSTPDRWKFNRHTLTNYSESVLYCKFCSFQTSYRCEMRQHRSTDHPNEAAVSSILDNVAKKKGNSANDSDVPGASQNETGSSAGTDTSNTDLGNFKVAPNFNREELTAIPQTEHEKSNNYVFQHDTSKLDFQSVPVLETQDIEQPFKCTVCDYKSKFKATVQRHHQRRHTDQKVKPYKCVNCGFSTKTKDQIALHNKRSISTVEVFCETCSYSTLFKCSLALHQKMHNSYRCTQCDYSCRQKYDLAKHMGAYHLGHGFKCQYCDFTAARKDTLVVHETTHTGKKPFQCRFCDYSAFRKFLLEAHVKNSHNEIVENVEKTLASLVAAFQSNSAGVAWGGQGAVTPDT